MEIPWNDSSGQKLNIDLSTPGKIKISSPRNTATTARSIRLKVTTTAGLPAVSRIITVNQKATVYTYEFTVSADKTGLAAGGGTATITGTLKTYMDGTLRDTKTVTPTLSGTATGFTISGNKVTAASRGTTVGNDRSITVTCTTVTPETKATLTQTITINQAKNIVVSAVMGVDNLVWGSTSSLSPKGGSDTVITTSDAVVTWSSGATSVVTPQSAPDFGFILRGTRNSSMAATTGFTWNASSKTLTAASMGTIAGDRTATIKFSSRYVIKMDTEYGGSTVTTPVHEASISKKQGTNAITYVNPVIANATTPVNLSIRGQTYTIPATASQTNTWTSGSTSAGQVTLTYAVKTAKTGFSLSTNKVTVTANTSTTARTGFVVTVTATGQGSKVVTKDLTFNQAAGSKTYSEITISNFSYAVIPAAGGSVNPTVSYSQTWGWNGSTTGGGTITSGATLAYSGTGVNTTSGAVSANSKGTTKSEQTTVTTATLRVTLNGKTKTVTYVVKQAKNAEKSITYGAWVVNISANKYTTASSPAPANGGNVTITRSASRTRTQVWDSNATSAMSNETAIPTLSVSGTGLTMSGTTATWANRTNTVGNARSGTVTATHSGVSKSVTLYQQNNSKVLDGIGLDFKTVNTVIPEAGGSVSLKLNFFYKYTSGSSVTENPAWSSCTYVVNGPSGGTLSNTGVFTATFNTTTNDREWTVKATHVSSGMTDTMSIFQDAGDGLVIRSFTDKVATFTNKVAGFKR